MRNLELLRHISIGQYIPGSSFVHRLDPRAKLLSLICLIAAVTFCSSYATHLILVLLCLIIARLASTPLRYVLSAIRPVLPVIVVFAVLQLFSWGGLPTDDAVLWRWRTVRITTGGIRLVIISLARLLELLILVSLLTNTTTVSQLAHGIELLLRPLDRLGFPGHEISLIFTIAFRFLPLLALQLETVMKAQACRGAGMATEGRWDFVRRTRRLLALFVPLFINAFRRSEHLITAMEARCYQRGGPVRTHLIQLRLERRDIAVALVVALVCLALVVGHRY